MNKESKRKIPRSWHHYLKWEDYQHGMWRTTTGEERVTLVGQATQFTGNHELYGYFMAKVIKEWTFGCEHNLSDSGSNRKAWLGHAAVCLAFGCPEDVTREAWGLLTEQQQESANAQAQKYIDIWEAEYETKNLGLHTQMGVSRVS
jgi:hypothetical protein